MRAPRHIQAALDRFFPGVRLEWNGVYEWWILTQEAVYPDGMVVRNQKRPTPRLLRGIEPFAWTSRGALLFWGEIETLHREPLSLVGILETLRKYWNGGSKQEAAREIDRLEEGEEAAHARVKEQQRLEGRDRAGDAWNALKRSSFGPGMRNTPWSHGRAVDKEFARQMQEQHGEMGAIADAEVAQRIKEGHGIRAVPRSPRPVVT